jgi:Xaa-Pro dipeptidase
VVTADGCEVITKFPAEELLVAGRKYWTAGGALDTLRESQSHLNTAAGRGDDPPKPPAAAGRGQTGPGEAT